MTRPNSVLGLTRNVIRERWQRLSKLGRFAVVATALVLGGSAIMSLTCATACSSSAAEQPPCACPHAP